MEILCGTTTGSSRWRSCRPNACSRTRERAYTLGPLLVSRHVSRSESSTVCRMSIPMCSSDTTLTSHACEVPSRSHGAWSMVLVLGDRRRVGQFRLSHHLREVESGPPRNTRFLIQLYDCSVLYSKRCKKLVRLRPRIRSTAPGYVMLEPERTLIGSREKNAARAVGRTRTARCAFD